MARQARPTSKTSERRRPAPARKRRPRAGGGTSSAAVAGALRGDTIRVRMYRVGFGDCFLLSLPTDGGHAHILIDCGVHSQGDLGLMPEIVDDIGKECGNHLSLIIATHAHQDHISGFAKCEDKFKTFKVDEVWLPWTEDPHDSLARKLKQKHIALAEALRLHMQAFNIRADDTPAGEALAAVMNAAGNPTALALLKSGVGGGTVRYLKAGLNFADAAGIKGLSAQILGPPTDQTFLARMDPPKGDRFFKLGADGAPVAVDAVIPFEKDWIVPAAALPAQLDMSAKEKAALRAMLDSTTELAFALDQALNNTSVVALLTYRGKHLLFPGDAQYGNWESWMTKPDAEAILQHIDFFKVAHHGSHNATPKSALDRMGEGFAAMISTQSKPWPSIPFAKMLKVLDQKASAVVRSDSIDVAGAARNGPKNLPKNLPKNAPKGPKLTLKRGSGFSVGAFWCDYAITL